MKNKIILFCFVILVYTLISCSEITSGGIKNNREIMQDIRQISLPLQEQMTSIDTMEITKRRSGEALDEVWVNIACSNDYLECYIQAKLEYGMYDVGGWVLDKVYWENMSQWYVIPKSLPNEELEERIYYMRQQAPYYLFDSNALDLYEIEPVRIDITSSSFDYKQGEYGNAIAKVNLICDGYCIYYSREYQINMYIKCDSSGNSLTWWWSYDLTPLTKLKGYYKDLTGKYTYSRYPEIDVKKINDTQYSLTTDQAPGTQLILDISKFGASKLYYADYTENTAGYTRINVNYLEFPAGYNTMIPIETGNYYRQK